MEEGEVKEDMDKESVYVGLRREDALCHSKWSVGVDKIAAGFEVNLATLIYWGYYLFLNIGVSIFTNLRHTCDSLFQ